MSVFVIHIIVPNDHCGNFVTTLNFRKCQNLAFI